MELLTQFADLIKFLIDFILHIDVHLAELVAQYGTWVYAILFLIVFVKRGCCHAILTGRFVTVCCGGFICVRYQ